MTNKVFVPLYRKIYQALKDQILSGGYPVGQRIPYERELCQQFQVERVTVRKALQMLSEEGLIEKRSGVGSFVTGRKADTPPVTESGANILFVMRQNQNDIRHNTTSCNTKLFFSMEELCRQNGYLLSYVGLDENSDLVSIVKEHAVCGVFLVSSYHERAIEDMRALNIPTVLLNHQDENLLSIMPDNLGMLKQVITYLAEMGHRRIAYIDGMKDSCNAEERWEGFKIAMYLNGLAVDPSLYFVGNWTFEGGEAAARELLQVKELPTAVFAASDMMAAGAMDVLKHHGLRIPQDISVIGYDNLDIDTVLSPQLSSATVDFRQMSSVAFEHLQAIMRMGTRDTDHYTIRMPAILIRRASVAPPAGEQPG